MAEIQSEFSWPIKNATLRSVLLNLVEKGQLHRRARGKAFFYTASVPRATLLHTMAQSLARVFAGGSPRELVSQLLETGDIKPDDLKLIVKAAEESLQRKKGTTDE